MQNNSSAYSLLFRRAVAFLYDCLLLIALFFIITAIAIAMNDGRAIQSLFYYLFLYTIAYIFFDWFWRHGGQTLGMRAWRIRLKSTEAEVITVKQTFTRYVSGTLLFGFTLLSLPFSSQHMALHDRLSKTKIIKFIK